MYWLQIYVVVREVCEVVTNNGTADFNHMNAFKFLKLI